MEAQATLVVTTDLINYFKIFCWVLSGLFALLGAAFGGLGWFIATSFVNLKDTDQRQWDHIGALRTDVDRIQGEHDTRSQICPALKRHTD